MLIFREKKSLIQAELVMKQSGYEAVGLMRKGVKISGHQQRWSRPLARGHLHTPDLLVVADLRFLASVQCFQQLFFLNGFVEGVGLADGTQFLGGIFQVFFYGDFFNVHGHGDLFVGVA